MKKKETRRRQGLNTKLFSISYLLPYRDQETVPIKVVVVVVQTLNNI